VHAIILERGRGSRIIFFLPDHCVQTDPAKNVGDRSIVRRSITPKVH
jgi:hypothetical protein